MGSLEQLQINLANLLKSIDIYNMKNTYTTDQIEVLDTMGEELFAEFQNQEEPVYLEDVIAMKPADLWEFHIANKSIGEIRKMVETAAAKVREQFNKVA